MNQPSKKIISLGYVIFNVKNQKVLQAKNLYVNPEEPLNPEIVKLTGVTEEHIKEEGHSLLEAYRLMVQSINNHNVTKHCVQWGTDDRELLEQLVKGGYNGEYIFRDRSYDVKSLYQIYQMSLPQSKTISGLKKSLNALGLGWDYTHGVEHNSLADAYNTMRILLKIQDKLKKFNEIEKIMG